MMQEPMISSAKRSPRFSIGDISATPIARFERFTIETFRPAGGYAAEGRP